MSARRAQPASEKPRKHAAVQKPPRARWNSGLPPGLFLVLAIAAFYTWTTTSSKYDFVWGTRKPDHYNLQAEGFLAGHLYLAQDPPKELLALKDPLDPVANAPYRLHDASLYKGHYYVYYGPAPVITLYLPWRVITGWSIPNNFAVLLYVLAGYIFSCLLLFQLLRAAGIQLSWLWTRVAIAALGLCQTVPIILRRPYMYETAVASAFCFFIGGMYFLARYVLGENPRPWHAVLAGLCLGLTPACRPNFTVIVVLVLAAYLLYLFLGRKLRGAEWIRDAAFFAAPMGVCGLLLMWFNWARFGSPLEFGQDYILVGGVLDRGVSPVISVLPNLYRFLIERPLVFPHFPFFELATNGPFGSSLWQSGVDHLEPICGLLIICPLCIAGLLLPFLFRRFQRELPVALRFVLLLLATVAVANMFAIVLVVHQVTQRYELDFAPALFIVSLFTMFFLAARLQDARARRAVSILLVAGCLAAAVMQAALSINSYGNDLMSMNPPQFARLASLFGDDETTLRRGVLGVMLDGEIKFPSRPPGTREALMTTGMRRHSNALFVEYVSNDRIRIGYSISGRAIQYGPEIPIVAGNPYPLQVRYPNSSTQYTIKVTIGEAKALDLSTAFYPTSFSNATVGRNDLGEPPNLQPFSGEITAPKGLQIAAPVD